MVTGIKCFDVLVVGHPRCGSGFCAYYLNLLGIKTVHEVDWDDVKWTKYQGLSSWAMTIVHEKNDGIKPSFGQFGSEMRNITYKNKIVHLRNPFDSFKAIMDENNVDWSYTIRNKYIIKKLNKNLNNYSGNLEKAIASYLFWYELLINEGYFFFRIEHDLNKLTNYLKDNVKQELNDLTNENINTKVNTKKNNNIIKKEDFSKVNKELMTHLNNFCIKYGYPTFEEYYLK